MTKIKIRIVLDCIEDLFKPFINKKGYVEISENIDPVFIMFIVMILGISKTFLLVIIDFKCPECGKKIHKYDGVDFFIEYYC